LNDTIDLGLFFQRNQEADLIGYADAGYFSDPQNGISQTGFVFLHRGTAISWKSLKQTFNSNVHKSLRDYRIIQGVKRMCLVA
jgi:hypothetical protein